MSVFSRIGNVFISPSQCFGSLRDEGTKWTDYVVTFALLIAMVVIFMVVTSDVMHKMQVDVIRGMEQLSDAQKDAAIANANSPIAQTFKYAGAILQVVIGALIGALVFWIVGNFIGGGDKKFGTLLAATLYVQMITIPETIIKMILAVQKGTMLVHVGFGSLLNNPDLTSFPVQFVNQLEFFAIWRVIVWILAFKALYNFSTKKSTILVVVTMIIGFLLMAGLATMQGGRFA
jgi:hypothetical protein